MSGKKGTRVQQKLSALKSPSCARRSISEAKCLGSQVHLPLWVDSFARSVTPRVVVKKQPWVIRPVKHRDLKSALRFPKNAMPPALRCRDAATFETRCREWGSPSADIIKVRVTAENLEHSHTFL
jgi:hypothetical protein